MLSHLNITANAHAHTPHTQALVLPFNILVSKLAKDMEDRAMMVNLNYLSFLRYVRHTDATHNTHALVHWYAYTLAHITHAQTQKYKHAYTCIHAHTYCFFCVLHRCFQVWWSLPSISHTKVLMARKIFSHLFLFLSFNSLFSNLTNPLLFPWLIDFSAFCHCFALYNIPVLYSSYTHGS